MRGYRLAYRDVLALPLAAFWGLSRNLDRLRAEEDLQQLDLIMFATKGSAENIEAYRNALRERMGTVSVDKPVFERESLQELKSMGRVV